ncbi:MAG: (E)-4-hydroxy-3-methylbut-2-enyl-diphosphate synthase [bacterium]
MQEASRYCQDILLYRRRKTREVKVGEVGVGGDNPIRVQSMTIADTLDTEATVREVILLVEAGCEIVRITAPSLREAENLKNIKAELTKRGVRVPLVADIHYTPNAALVAAEYVEKVRINPGNYADKKRFEQREYTEAEYAQELRRIEEKFKPLVLKCKSLGRALRIGTNHGSLSDRIMNRYGDTAEGMVESALEFVRICEKYEFHDIILSMKSSNPLVAIQAYRLLAARMLELGMTYPFHLGVTEAGDGAEGRIKSAVGIGGLLEDGIGDTIRVSLTEDAVAEVPVAFKLVEKFNNLAKNGNGVLAEAWSKTWRNSIRTPSAFEYQRRNTLVCDQVYHKLGSEEVPRVELSLTTPLSDVQAVIEELAGMLGKQDQSTLPLLSEQAFVCETVHVKVASPQQAVHLQRLREAASRSGLEVPFAVDFSDSPELACEVAGAADRLVFSPRLNGEMESVAETVKAAARHNRPVEWKLTPGRAFLLAGVAQFSEMDESVRVILNLCRKLDYWNVLFSLSGEYGRFSIVSAYRYLAGRLDALGAHLPILLRYTANGRMETALLQTASQLGALLCDGIGDTLHLDSTLPATRLLPLGYDILQATRLRISKTEYISCPSCGRTLFDLQTTTERIKSKTDHLKGVKIAIMGCIVNGPGEMADADFGYVGAGPGKVNLFVGKECVERNIPQEHADERLIELIKKQGKWVEQGAGER